MVMNHDTLQHELTHTRLLDVSVTSLRRGHAYIIDWVFRDVVFQDVGFQTTSFKPLTHISFRCEVPTPSVVEGQSNIMFKPHILKHHIPELPNLRRSDVDR